MTLLLFAQEEFEPAKASELKFKSSLDRIDAFLRLVCEAVRRNKNYKWHWFCEEKKWRLESTNERWNKYLNHRDG